MLLLALLATSIGALAPDAARAARAPLLSAHGDTLLWSAVGRHRTFRLSIAAPDGTSLITVRGRRIAPRPRPGTRVRYRVRAAYRGSAWSNAVSIDYRAAPAKATLPASVSSAPAVAADGPGAAGLAQGGLAPPSPGAREAPTPSSPPAPGEEPQTLMPPPPEPPGMVVGLNAGGWGPSAFADIAGAARAVRLESSFATDEEVGAAAAAGVTVGSWLAGAGGSIQSIDPATYAAEIVTLFKRYGRGGSFWSGRPDLGGQAVEVLNEPGNPTIWKDPTDYAAYVSLLKEVHQALVANFPEATRPKLLASWDGGEAPASTFGEGWAALGGLAYVDGVTVHPYGGSEGQNGGALGGRTGVEQAHLLSGKPVYVTEIGWPTATGKGSTGDSQQWTEAQQAENIRSFVNWARGTGYVEMVVIFNYVDYGAKNFYGIETEERTHKLSYTALAEVSR